MLMLSSCYAIMLFWQSCSDRKTSCKKYFQQLGFRGFFDSLLVSRNDGINSSSSSEAGIRMCKS